MDLELYEKLVTYLSTLVLPPNVSPDDRTSFLRISSQYIVIGSLLYRKNRRHPNKLLRVVTVSDVELVMRAFHSDPLAGHFGAKRTFQKIAERYFWPDMQKQVYDFVKTCDTCRRRGPPPTRPEPLHPLPVSEPFDRVGIDMVGPLPTSPRGYRYIIRLLTI